MSLKYQKTIFWWVGQPLVARKQVNSKPNKPYDKKSDKRNKKKEKKRDIEKTKEFC